MRPRVPVWYFRYSLKFSGKGTCYLDTYHELTYPHGGVMNSSINSSQVMWVFPQLKKKALVDDVHAEVFRKLQFTLKCIKIRQIDRWLEGWTNGEICEKASAMKC